MNMFLDILGCFGALGIFFSCVFVAGFAISGGSFAFGATCAAIMFAGIFVALSDELRRERNTTPENMHADSWEFNL